MTTPSQGRTPAGPRSDASLPDVERRVHEAATPAERAEALLVLAESLSGAGRAHEAVDASSQAVALLRALADADPAAHAPGLAMALNNLSIHLAGTGDAEDALRVGREATALLRNLAASDPGAHSPGLAMSLTNLATRLASARRREEALLTAREAVDVYRALVVTAPELHTENLAGALANLAVHLRGTGRREDSLDAVRESVGLFIDLARADPGAHTAHAARGMGLLATFLRDAGRQEEAAAAFTEHIGELPPASRAHVLLTRQEWRLTGSASKAGGAGSTDPGDLLAAVRETEGIEDPGDQGPARRAINQHVQNHAASGAYGALPPLPAWATVAIDGELADAMQEWLQVGSPAEELEYVERRWPRPTAEQAGRIAAVADLYVDAPQLRRLAGIVAQVNHDGDDGLARFRAQVAGAQLLIAWLAEQEAGRGRAFMEAHPSLLTDPAVREYASSLPQGPGRTAIAMHLNLASVAGPQAAYAVMGGLDEALDAVRGLIDDGNWQAPIFALALRTELSDHAPYGTFAGALHAAASGDVGTAQDLLTKALAASNTATTEAFGRLLYNATLSPDCPRGLHALLGSLTSRS